MQNKSIEIDLKSIGEDGTFTGYASVFGVRDSYGEIVAPGAFTKSLAKRPANKVRMLWSHRAEDVIGVWDSLVEDGRGLLAKGRLILDVPEGKRAYTLMKAGAVDGMSIGFRTVQDRIDRQKGARILEEVDLLEISLVAFPANEDATVSAVKHNGTSFSDLVAAINGARRAISN